MTFMKNREKFAKEIMDIACSGSGIAMKGGVLVPCDGLRCTLRCTECDFSSLIPSTNNRSCDISVKEWCESEYVEPSIDCSKIANKFGGGGHKGAAGFRSKENIFAK